MTLVRGKAQLIEALLVRRGSEAVPSHDFSCERNNGAAAKIKPLRSALGGLREGIDFAIHVCGCHPLTKYLETTQVQPSRPKVFTKYQ